MKEGVYSFVLKVTDQKDQSSTDKVMVFVKSQDEHQLVVKAGQNQTITLPISAVLLNGTNSTYTANASFIWTQTS